MKIQRVLKMKKILIIDDDKSFLSTTELIFQAKGFDVLKAETAEEGMSVLKTDSPDVLLLDVNLPDKNGFDVLKTLKRNKNYSDLCVFMITGDNTVQIDKAFELGADDCFFKPLNIDEIIKKMEEC